MDGRARCHESAPAGRGPPCESPLTRGPGPQGGGVPHVTPQGAFSHSGPWRRLEGRQCRAWRCRGKGPVVRPDGRRGAATPGPAGPEFGPKGGPKEMERPEAAPAGFRRSLRSRRPAAPVARLKRFGAGAERGRTQTHPPPPPALGRGSFPPPPPKGSGETHTFVRKGTGLRRAFPARQGRGAPDGNPPPMGGAGKRPPHRRELPRAWRWKGGPGHTRARGKGRRRRWGGVRAQGRGAGRVGPDIRR